MAIIRSNDAPVTKIRAVSYTFPTEEPESDGTLRWDATTMVLVHAESGGKRGIGYTYSHKAAAVLINDLLAEIVEGRSAMHPQALRRACAHRARNLGDSGITAMAVAAVDNALWDLKAKLLDLPLVLLLGEEIKSVPLYGSGGFTSYDLRQLEGQLEAWTKRGIGQVKMKVGRHPEADQHRVRAARAAIGVEAGLFVDANGAFKAAQAIAMAHIFEEQNVGWFEEPVVHQDIDGLRRVREKAPPGMEIACGEYGFHLGYFRRMLESGAVDVLQADATRCGLSVFMEAAALCRARNIPLSSHCAPTQHLHICSGLPEVRHMEYFHDHVRIENLIFEGQPQPVNGRLSPDLSLPGIGIFLKETAREYAD